jgi:capsular polysaccharide biosynthesis protein
MTEQTTQTYGEDDASLLDILAILAESWKLLLFGPLIAGLLAGGLSFLWPKTFESVAIVRMAEEEVALLHAAPVLDPLIEKFGLLVEADGIQDDAHKDLKKRLTFAVDKKTKLATITAKARIPEDAQAIADSAIALVLKELQAKGQEKALIEKNIAINNRAIETAEDAVDSIQRGFKRGVMADQFLESATKNLAAISSDIARRSQENEQLRIKLDSKGAEVFVQKPSLPQRKSAPNLSLVVILAVLVSGAALLLWVFICKAWGKAIQDPKSVAKLNAIKRSLGLL